MTQAETFFEVWNEQHRRVDYGNNDQFVLAFAAAFHEHMKAKQVCENCKHHNLFEATYYGVCCGCTESPCYYKMTKNNFGCTEWSSK